MPQSWPWVKVTERSPSTFPQTHIFLVPNIYGLAQTVLTWEAKVLAAADAATVVDAAETNWKHEVTPDWGDLIMDVRVLTGLVCPAARPRARPPALSGDDNTPEPLRAAG